VNSDPSGPHEPSDPSNLSDSTGPSGLSYPSGTNVPSDLSGASDPGDPMIYHILVIPLLIAFFSSWIIFQAQY